jgi:nicotinate-nucleotide adenylyltransferase
MTKPMRIAVCGGTFDPFHRGHLEPLLAVRDAMHWDRIVYVPAQRQPFKVDSATASGFHRYAMAVLATSEVDAAWISAFELERDVVSYTVDTLEHLRQSYGPDAAFDWVIGDDNLARLDEWKSLERIFELASFVVLSRGNAAVPDDFKQRVAAVSGRPGSGAVILAKNEMVPVSATEIRRRVRDGESISDMVDPRVSRYIHHYNLYRGSRKGTT